MKSSNNLLHREVTDKDTMEVAEMVLNKINKGLVSMMEKVGVKAVGISGKDGSVLRVKKKLSKGEAEGVLEEIFAGVAKPSPKKN